MPAPLAPPADHIWGAWFVCADGCAHYFLSGKCLCDCARRAVRAVTISNWTRGSAVVEHQCEECGEANANRWAGVPA
jgi:hypothetical protein